MYGVSDGSCNIWLKKGAIQKYIKAIRMPTTVWTNNPLFFIAVAFPSSSAMYFETACGMPRLTKLRAMMVRYRITPNIPYFSGPRNLAR